MLDNNKINYYLKVCKIVILHLLVLTFLYIIIFPPTYPVREKVTKVLLDNEQLISKVRQSLLNKEPVFPQNINTPEYSAQLFTDGRLIFNIVYLKYFETQISFVPYKQGDTIKLKCIAAQPSFAPLQCK